MQSSKISPAIIRICGVSLLIILVAVAIKTGAIQSISRQIRTMVWHPQTPWSLEIEQTFLKCGHRLHLENTYSSETAIRSYVRRHPEYRFAKSRAAQARHRLSGVEELADYCPTCRTKQFFGIRDQQVVVLRGTPGQPGPVKEKTSIQLRLLPAVELDDLRKGIPFQNEKDKLQLIEGLNGLTTN